LSAAVTIRYQGIAIHVHVQQTPAIPSKYRNSAELRLQHRVADAR